MTHAELLWASELNEQIWATSDFIAKVISLDSSVSNTLDLVHLDQKIKSITNYKWI